MKIMDKWILEIQLFVCLLGAMFSIMVPIYTITVLFSIAAIIVTIFLTNTIKKENEHKDD